MQLNRWSTFAGIIIALASVQSAAGVTITWTGGGGSNSWHTAANWDLNRVPQAGDNVVIPDMIPDVNVTYSSGSTTIDSLASAEAFTLSGGTLTIDAASSLDGTFALSGTLSGAGDITVNGAMNWTGFGAMSGSGRTIIASFGSLTISDNATKTLGRTLENHSANVVWTGGPINFNNGNLSNETDGTFTADGGSILVNGGGTNAVNNDGIFNKTGAGTLTSGVPFSNTGTVNLDGGALNLGAGANTGTIDADAGTTLTFGATYTQDGTSALTGQGTLTFGGGTHTLTGTLHTDRTININAAVNFDAPYSFTGTVNLTGTLSGAGDATIAGALNWSGFGAMSGSGRTIIASSGSLTISDNATKTLGRTLENHSANVVWTGGPINFNNGNLSNETDGTFTADGGSILVNGGGTNAVNNDGIFNKTGAGTLTCGVPFTNTGTVNLDGGALNLGAGANTGTIDADAGTTLTFGATYTQDGASALTGQGTLTFGGGTHTLTGTLHTDRTININAAVNFDAPYSFTGTVNLTGTLSGAGDATIAGALTWMGFGTMSGSGRTIIASSGSLTISDNATKTLGRTLENHSANAIWTGGQFNFNNGNLSNETDGTITADGGSILVNGGGTNAVNNDGIFNKTGAGTLTSGVPFSNTGTIDVQDGILSLAGGLTNGTGSTLTGGTYIVAGTLRYLAADIATNAASIILDGPTSAIQNTSGGNAFTNFATNSADGTFQIQNGRNFALAGAFSNAGHVTIGPGDNTFSAGTFGNSGAITHLSPGAGSIDSTVSLTGNGLIDVQGGTLTLTTLTNFSGTTLTGGTYQAGGTLRFGNADIVDNAASIILEGPAAAIENTLGANGLANLAANSAAGAIQIRNGRNLALAGDFRNAGQVTIGPGDDTLSLPGNYVQSAGITMLDGGSLDPADLVDIQGGELSGNGTVLGNVTNSALCRPGLSAGSISIDGDYMQMPSGTLEAEIGGTVADTEYDHLSVSGGVILLGTLQVLLINGFEPEIGDAFDIVTGNSVSVKFTTIDMPTLLSLKGWEIDYSNALNLSVIDCGPGDADGDGVGDDCETDPDLSWYSIDGGGRTFSSGGAFRVGATIGQHDAGSFTTPMTGGGFTLVGGFWAGHEPTEVPTCQLLGDMNSDGQRNGIDIQEFAGCVLSGGGLECACADIDENGTVDTVDVAMFVQVLLN